MGCVCTPLGLYKHMGCMNIQGVYEHRGNPDIPQILETCLLLRKVGKTLFKPKFLHLGTGKNIREPPDCTGNEPTPDIPIGGFGQDIKKKWQIHAICENMLIMKHVSHLSTDKEGKKT